MRPVDQVVADLTKAREATVAAKRTEQRFESELREVQAYLADILKPNPAYREIDHGEGNRG
jgi:hypothetical protein